MSALAERGEKGHVDGMHDIEHDPDEPDINRHDKTYLLAFIGGAIMWVVYLMLFEIQWHQVGLAAFSGALVAAWAIEETGNKTPDWLVPRKKNRARGTGKKL